MGGELAASGAWTVELWRLGIGGVGITGVFCWLRGTGCVCLRKGPAGRVSMSISCSFGRMEMAGSSGGLYEYVSYAVSGFKVHAVLG